MVIIEKGEVEVKDKIFTIRRYNLSLFNVDPILNLEDKKKEINDAITKFTNGSVNGDPYDDVQTINVIKTTKRNIQLECKESNILWHIHLEKELAENYGMSEFCYKDIKNDADDLMFQWN